MDINQMIAVLQANKAGKPVELRFKDRVCNFDQWEAFTGTAQWNFAEFEYRVKPEPREWWINLYPSDQEHSEYDAYRSKEAADVNAGSARLACVHVREVID